MLKRQQIDQMSPRFRGTSGWSSGAGGGELGLLHHDRGVLHAFAADDAEQHGGVAGMQAYAAVRRRPAKLGNVVAAVDGKTAVEEDRVRHRRIVVFVREPLRRHGPRMEDAGRCAVSLRVNVLVELIQSRQESGFCLDAVLVRELGRDNRSEKLLVVIAGALQGRWQIYRNYRAWASGLRRRLTRGLLQSCGIGRLSEERD